MKEIDIINFKFYDVDKEKIKLFEKINMRIKTRMNVNFLNDLTEETKNICYNLMRQTMEHLQKELGKIEKPKHKKVIEIKV